MLRERYELSVVGPTREIEVSFGAQCYLISVHVGITLEFLFPKKIWTLDTHFF